MKRSRVLVCGAGGFIGTHMVERLCTERCWVRGVDLHHPPFSASAADDFVIGDLRDSKFCDELLVDPYDEIYQFAADMGGAGYIFSGDHDDDIMRNSSLVNINILSALVRRGPTARIFFSSSACIYPGFNQIDPDNPNCAEASAYPALPDSEYGWEKLFSERLYLAHARKTGAQVRIARYHNIFGPLSTWRGGREKAPAAICRKVAQAGDGDTIEVWGDGTQTRTFLYISECIEGTRRLMRSDYGEPINIGSEELVSINRLVQIVSDIAGKKIAVRHVGGPLGVRGRKSDNRQIARVLGWQPRQPLRVGLEQTYEWIADQNRENSGP